MIEAIASPSYYVDTVTNGLITGSSTVSGTTTYCVGCNGWYSGWSHHCPHVYVSPDITHEHDYAQAASPYESTLFCRKCGETKQLKRPKVKATE